MAEMSESTKVLSDRKRIRVRRKRKKKPGSGDFMLTSLVLGLTVFGLIMVFSASYYTAINNFYGKAYAPYMYFIRQSVFALGSSIICIILAFIDYHIISRFAVPVYVFVVMLIGLTYVPGIGAKINNAARWIQVGPITVIPGELAKLACILLCAWWIIKKEHGDLDLTHSLLPLLAIISVAVLLVYLQPSTTTAATILIIVFGMLFVAGIRVIYIAYAFSAGILAMVLHMLTSGGGYRSSRLMSFLDPFADEMGSGYQVVQGLYALASGGLKGLGLGKSIQKTLYLPDPQNDFIFAIIGEELGYIGLLLLLAAYMLLIWRCVRIALKAPDFLGMLIASGITVMLAVQVLMNIMVVTALMPPTGVTLPFISYGGTGLLLFLSAMGIMINISRHEKTE